ncbi:Glycogen synthase [Actinoplanes sp. SE50]|uniref:glycosyltransferase family 4 protein n=1 Tax=unclassified Actinoplanes TaxID=2626549 RepID=UPI00023EDD8A|nr:MULTISPECIES: glycosyltransferase family 4 protein [unclassified Actinoplanes]AEV88628.1 Glycogen synthase [Actinoplanes sp. SE50/110]ATO87032.1 Glycogen synthase [Actinoplanes sp. SE50]SLM04450.1 glycogen synthase [Actinoplanes sp. SE50/110]
MSDGHRSVVYVALGEFRIRAAVTLTAEYAAAGAKVTLFAGRIPEWKDVKAPAGVTLKRVGDKAWPEIREALAGADLLIAGDPPAMPIVDLARKEFPRLTVRTDPQGDPERRPAPADLAIVTPWYPSPNDTFAGSFVKAAAETVQGQVGRVSILATDHWFYPPWRMVGNMIDITMQRELKRFGGVTVQDTPEGELTRVIAPQPRKQPYATWANEQIRRLRAALPTGRIEAPLVHAHSGHFGGVMAAALARPDARIIVTEHATFLRQVFAQPKARQQYLDMLARAETLLCVSSSLRDQVAEEFPYYAHKLRVVPNPVDFEHFAVRPGMPEAPRRWVYAGRMVEHKGVMTLVDGFALIAAEDPSVTLTLVGEGKLEDDLRKRITELKLTDRIQLRPAVPPEQMVALLHEHDLLVHASQLETFGMTMVEAVATGTPVLVAASQGPAETLEGLDGIAGRLFPVTKKPEVLAEAWRELRDEWSKLDLPRARAELHARYGFEAVGEQLLDIYRNPAPAEAAAPVPVPAEDPAERIIVVAVLPSRPARTRDFVKRARAKGYGVDLIVPDPAKWAREAEDPGIVVHGIGTEEDPPGVVIRPAPMTGSAAALALTRTVQGKARTLRTKVAAKVGKPTAAVFRPHTKWLATRSILPAIDFTRVKRVVVNGVQGERIGWQIARRHPGLEVTTALRLPGDKHG